jgi:HD-like signal output (HDOD) protein
MMQGKRKIGELLVEGGWVTDKELEKALAIQRERGERIGRTLIDLGYLTEESFLEFLTTNPNTPSVDLSSCEIEREIIDLVPGDYACRLELVPIWRIGKMLTVGMVCPLDEAGKKELEHVTGLKIRALLCSRAAILSALQRYYAKPTISAADDTAEGKHGKREEPLQLCEVARLAERIEELPTLPEILNRVSAVVNDPKSSASELAKVIATDGALSSKILRLANSPAYGFSRKITDIKHAVAMIGFKETQALAISVSAFDKLKWGAESEFRTYWKHSLACATLARMISVSLKVGGMESAFISGLLHDMGKVVLAGEIHRRREEASSHYLSGEPIRPEEEAHLFGITHAETGYLLAEHWLLPPVVVNAVRYHHSLDAEFSPQAPSTIVFLANTFCRMERSELRKALSFDAKVSKALKTLEISEEIFRNTLMIYADTDLDMASL